MLKELHPATQNTKTLHQNLKPRTSRPTMEAWLRGRYAADLNRRHAREGARLAALWGVSGLEALNPRCP